MGLNLFVQVLQDSVPIVANTILPLVAEATVGIKAMPVPLTEIHAAARAGLDEYGDSTDVGLEDFVSLGSLGDRADAGRRIREGGEVLLRDLVMPPRWDEAVREALVTMAMDWGFPEPKFD